MFGITLGQLTLALALFSFLYLLALLILTMERLWHKRRGANVAQVQIYRPERHCSSCSCGEAPGRFSQYREPQF